MEPSSKIEGLTNQGLAEMRALDVFLQNAKVPKCQSAKTIVGTAHLRLDAIEGGVGEAACKDAL